MQHGLHWIAVPFCTLLLGSHSTSTGSGACNNTTYTVVSPPGKQQETVTSSGCAQGSIELQVKISAEGDVIIVEGDVEGSVKATIQSPASCTSSFVWHSAEIHECGNELEGWNCNPKQHSVRVKYYEIADPCPDTTDLLALVSQYASQVMSGNPFTIPLKCKQPLDATATLDPEAKTRNSAGIVKCTDGPQAPAGGFGPEWREFGTSVYVDVSSLPSHYDIESFIPDGALVPGVIGLQLDGTPASGPLTDCPALASLLASYGAPPWVHDLECDVEELTWTAPGSTAPPFHREVTHLSGDLWANGNLRLDRQLSVLTTGPETGPRIEQFSERWSRSDGDVFHGQVGLESAMVYPVKNGAAAFISSCELLTAARLSEWLTDPFGLGVLGSTGFAEAAGDVDGQLRFERERFGQRLTLVVDQHGAVPRIIERTVHDRQGVLLRRSTYGRVMEVGPGAWRPMDLLDEVLETGSSPARSTLYSLSGRTEILSAQPSMQWPQPTLDRWTIWIR